MTDRELLTKEEIAKGYDAIVDKVGLEARFYDDCVAMHSGYAGQILDIGCGRGFLLQKLQRKAAPGTQFFGIDISEKLCAITRENVPEATVVVGDAEALPYSADSFDYIFMTEALEHMQNFGKALSEVHRVLKPGGIFIVTVPNRDWLRYDFYDKMRNHSLQPIDDHYFRFSEIKGLLEQNSFKVLAYRGLDNLWYYGWKHKFEDIAAFFLPFLHKKMKRLIFKCQKTV